MASSDPKPIVSSRADDPDVEERIDAFVFDLGDRIDTLQDLEMGHRPAPLREAAQAFRDDAQELGYEPLAAMATRLMVACDEGTPEAVRKAVVDLTELSKRVRAGHRGAA